MMWAILLILSQTARIKMQLLHRILVQVKCIEIPSYETHAAAVITLIFKGPPENNRPQATREDCKR